MGDDLKLKEERRQQRIVEAMGRLLGNKDFQFFVDEVLVEGLLRQRDENDELTGEALIRGQGTARAYRKILKDVDNSPELYVRLRVREAARVRGLSTANVPVAGQRSAY